MTEPLASDPADDPRPHHYRFAHRVLPGVARGGPIEFALAMAGVDARERIVDIWDALGREIAAEGSGEALPAGILDARSFALLERPFVLVQLPEPLGLTECYFVGVLLDAMPSAEQLERRESPPGLRVFTLERGWSPQGSRTVLGEWTEGQHIAYGTGPVPEAVAFAKAIEELIGSSRKPLLAVAS